MLIIGCDFHTPETSSSRSVESQVTQCHLPSPRTSPACQPERGRTLFSDRNPSSGKAHALRAHHSEISSKCLRRCKQSGVLAKSSGLRKKTEKRSAGASALSS